MPQACRRQKDRLTSAQESLAGLNSTVRESDEKKLLSNMPGGQLVPIKVIAPEVTEARSNRFLLLRGFLIHP